MQKAFIKGVPCYTEHQFKVWRAILDARRNQCNITVVYLTWVMHLVLYATSSHCICIVTLLPYWQLHHFIPVPRLLPSPWSCLFQSYQLSAAISYYFTVYLYPDNASECWHLGHHLATHHTNCRYYNADTTCLTATYIHTYQWTNCLDMPNTTWKWLDIFLLKYKVPNYSHLRLWPEGPVFWPTPILHWSENAFLGSKSISFVGLPPNQHLAYYRQHQGAQSELKEYLQAKSKDQSSFDSLVTEEMVQPQPTSKRAWKSLTAATLDLLIEESHTIYHSVPNAASHHSIALLVLHWHAWVGKRGIDSLSHVLPSTPLAVKITYLASLAPINLSHTYTYIQIAVRDKRISPKLVWIGCISVIFTPTTSGVFHHSHLAAI